MNINLNDFVKELYKKEKQSNIELQIAFDMYLTKVKSTNSPATYKCYKGHIDYLNRWLVENKIYWTDQINDELIYKYINYQHSKNNSNRYINKHILLLKSVFNHLIELDILDTNPITIKKIKETEKEIQIISKEDIKRILEHIKKLDNKSQLIVLLLISTGIRRTELTKIQTKYINIDESYIYLEDTKNKKPGLIYLNDQLKSKIKIELDSNPGSKYLFTSINDNQKPMTPEGISSIITRIGNALNIPNLSPHKFRHTFATTLLNQTDDIETVRQLMRHEKYEMTMRYLHLDKKKLKDKALKFNPLAII